MTVDAGTVSAIAALLVALIALVVTLAQTIQQYFVTGQLIRTCDSVVYGRMPGQGRRVWELSQFRFRVVYSIPQISLPSSLWLSISSHSSPDAEGYLPLPDLRPSNPKSLPASGEASWVSFTRAIQFSSGKSLRYELVEGDADRCPLDLPVVPMQLSMRDVVAVAMMAGMECTDVSFQLQSLSMQGTAGTITTSRHPVLGALIHFAPKRPRDEHGLRIDNGTIKPHWMVRLWDVVVVAGCQYDARDRKHFEQDEGPWVKLSGHRTVVDLDNLDPHKHILKTTTLRRRQCAGSSSTTLRRQTSGLIVENVSGMSHDEILKGSGTDSSRILLHRPQDGDWSFIIGIHDNSISSPVHQDPFLRAPEGAQTHHSSNHRLLQTILSLWRHIFFGHDLSGSVSENSILPISEQKNGNRSLSNLSTKHVDDQYLTEIAHSKSSTPPDPRTATNYRRRTKGFPKGKDLQAYINEKREATNNQHREDDDYDSMPRRLPLMNNESLHDETETNLEMLSDSEDWGTKQERDLIIARTEEVVEKWKGIVKKRGEERRRISRQDSPSRIRQTESSYPPSTKSDRRFFRLKNGRNHGSSRSQSYSRKQSPGLLNERSSQVDSEHSRPRGRRRNSSLRQADMGQKSRSSLIEYGQSSIGHSRRRQSKTTGDSLSLEPKSRGRGRVRVLSPSRQYSSPEDSTFRGLRSGTPKPIKGVLRKPRDRFPEDPEPTREGVAPLQDAGKKGGIPSNAKWTKIDRRLVNPAALIQGNERFEKRQGFVIVLRVLTREEVQEYAVKTMEIRGLRTQSKANRVANSIRLPEDVDGSGDSEDSEASNASFERVPVRVREEETPPARTEHEQDSLHASQVVANQDKRLVPFRAQSNGRWGPNLDRIEKLELKTVKKEPDHPEEPESAVIHDTVRRVHTPGSADDNIERTKDSNSANVVDGSEFSPFMTTGIEKENRNIWTPLNAVNFGDPDTSQESDDSKGTGQDKSGDEEIDISIELNPQLHRYETDPAEQSITFGDEVLLLTSESVQKKCRSMANQCIDIAVALKFFRDSQSDARYADGQVALIHEKMQELKHVLKGLLGSMESHRDQKKVSQFVVAEIEILAWSLPISLDALEMEFALFDVVPMNPNLQRDTWDQVISDFKRDHSCSLLDHLQTNLCYATEILRNLKNGRFYTIVSDCLKAHIPGIQHFTPRLLSPGTSDERYLLHRSRLSSCDLNSPLHQQDSKTSSSASESESPSLERSRSRLSDSGQSRGLALRQRKSLEDDDDSSLDDTVRQDYSSGTQYDSTSTSVTEPRFLPTGEVNWLWICQADIVPGYFATPWKHSFSEAVCVGAISVVLRGLESFTNASTQRYVRAQRRYRDWISAGKTTYPSYAINANGGVVVSGTYCPVTFATFTHLLPPIELLESYEYQVNRTFLQDKETILNSIAELMGLDSWLSLSGRLPEIYSGPSNLLRMLPTLMQQIMTDFEYEFSNLDRSFNDGGFQIIQSIADSLKQALMDQELSESEQLFFMVALLRAAKTALCVVHGPDTGKLREVFLHDVQVYLA